MTADAEASASIETTPAEDGAVTARAEGLGVVEGGGLPAEEPEAVGTAGSDEPEAIASTRDDESENVPQESTTARGFAGDELPQTGSPLALTSLLALLSLGGVAAFRRFYR